MIETVYCVKIFISARKAAILRATPARLGQLDHLHYSQKRFANKIVEQSSKSRKCTRKQLALSDK